MTMQIRNEGIYNSLIAQLDKVARHNRQGSYRTKERYYKAMKRFCRFLAEEYHLQKLANIAPKHLNAYIVKLQAEGKSAAPSRLIWRLSASFTTKWTPSTPSRTTAT